MTFRYRYLRYASTVEGPGTITDESVTNGRTVQTLDPPPSGDRHSTDPLSSDTATNCPPSSTV